MKKRISTTCAVVCTLSVLSMICLGQIKKNRSVSHSVLTNVEALTEDESPEKGYSSTHWICWKYVNCNSLL